MQAHSARGLIFDVKRFAIHDGPGIRTTFFFKGCPLRCSWCQNPEGISFEQEVFYREDLCIHCGQCSAACPQGAHALPDGSHVFTRRKCTVSGLCAVKCPTKALEIVGYEMTTKQIMGIALRDRKFYEKSNGGMTLSGGEPMSQFAFARSVLVAAKSEGIHTALDTTGCAPWADFERILKYVDVFLYDVKDTNVDRHKQNTGVELELILNNLKRLDAAGSRILLRSVIVPGVNDTPEHAAALNEVYDSLKNAVSIESIPFHTMGAAKWRALGKEAPE